MTQHTIKNWKKIKIFNTYEQAAELKAKLLNEAENENLEVKIKRSGTAGTKFTVKTYRPSK